MKKSYSVVADIAQIDEAFGDESPFRLKSDAKNHDLCQEDLKKIAKELAEEIINGFDRKSCSAQYWAFNHQINYAKIRVVDMERKKGKSNGYRCVVLCDMIENEGYLLHIFNHNDKDNLSPTEKTKLKALVNQYVSQRYK